MVVLVLGYALSFRSFRCPLFCKPVTGQELFLLFLTAQTGSSDRLRAIVFLLISIAVLGTTEVEM